jgi:hypothetical protein
MGRGILNEKQMGNRWGEMGRDGDEEISSRATWDQGGWILLQQGGFQVSKGGSEREQRGLSKGRQKARESAIVF